MTPTFPSPDLQTLLQLQTPPPPFTPGEPQFWTDPHIAQQMLRFHLDPMTDAASRRPETIERSVAWLVDYLHLQPGDAVLDLGCGPGLYAARLAAYGLSVTGIDFSQSSFNYAQEYAAQHGLAITYRCQNYLELEDESRFDVALLIYGDLCPLSPPQRARLFANVRRALKPGGRFVFDVTTPHLRRRIGLKNSWYVAQSGFWKPGLHLVLEQGFPYPDDIYLDQYVVVEADGKICVYRNWFQDYTAERIRAELELNRLTCQSLWSDLTGTPLAEPTDWIGIIASKS